MEYTNDPIERICHMQPYTGIRVHGLSAVHEKVWGFVLNRATLNVENCFSVKIARKLLENCSKIALKLLFHQNCFSVKIAFPLKLPVS